MQDFVAALRAERDRLESRITAIDGLMAGHTAAGALERVARGVYGMPS